MLEQTPMAQQTIVEQSNEGANQILKLQLRR